MPIHRIGGLSSLCKPHPPLVITSRKIFPNMFPSIRVIQHIPFYPLHSPQPSIPKQSPWVTKVITPFEISMAQISYMRRTPYNDRVDRSYLRVGRPRNSDPEANSFRIESLRIPEDNFMTPRTPLGYYQSRAARPLVHRPLTTQKTNPQLQHRRQGSEQQRYEHLQIGAQRGELMGRSEHPLDSTRGKLYRGSSWKYEDKLAKSMGAANTSRYSSHRKEQGQQPGDEQRRKKSSTLLDLIGQNLRKSEVQREQDFFEYIMRFSYRTKKGYIPNNSAKVNQDSFIINPNINGKTWQHLFAVCDGHGPLGHHVSAFIKNSLPGCLANVKTLEKHPREGVSKAFEAAYEKLLRDSKVDMSFSGSTVISCYLQQNKLICANVGDSRAILGRAKSSKWEAIALSNDHKPTIEKQAQRIRKMKGRVQAFKDEYGDPIGPLRVWVQNDNVPGLAMTRSFGDLVGASVGVSPIPEIKQFTLSDEDRMIVIGSDGVFEFLENQQIIRALVPYYEAKQIQQASDHLLNMAVKSWNRNSSIVDDITFILIFISYGEI